MKTDRSFSSVMMDIVIHTTMIVLLIVTLYPVLNIASVSISSADAFNRGLVSFYPREITFSAYRMVWEAGTVPKSFVNSILYTSVGTVINLLMTIMMAYPLSKKRLALRGFYMAVVVITMYFGGGLIPEFLLVKTLKLYNTFWVMVIPGAISTWNLIVLRSFFQSLPDELEESAYLDGANDFNILFQLVLPLSKAAVATIGLFYAVSHWNGWFNALIYLKDSSRYPLQLVLRSIVIQGQMNLEMAMQSGGGDDTVRQTSSEAIKYATLFISILPMLVIYPFIQKYFVKGVMIGSLKG